LLLSLDLRQLVAESPGPRERDYSLVCVHLIDMIIVRMRARRGSINANRATFGPEAAPENASL
jgi:hypothetical protein